MGSELETRLLGELFKDGNNIGDFTTKSPSVHSVTYPQTVIGSTFLGDISFKYEPKINISSNCFPSSCLSTFIRSN